MSRTKQIYTNHLNVSESTLKLKMMSYFFQILLMTEVICKQRLLYECKIGEHLQNCKCYDVYQGLFRKPLQSYKKNCPMRVRIFFTGRSVLAIFDA